MHPRRVIGGLVVAVALVTSVASTSTTAHAAVDGANVLAATRAVDWLATQQQVDGGFEVAQFPGFETPEALLAFASAVQGDGVWSGALALRAAQRAVNREGKNGLDYIDDYAEATGDDAISGGVAAKLITLTAGPLCLDARRFDPQRDGAVDLVAVMDAARRDNGAFGPDGVFSDTLYAVLAHATLARAVPPATIEFIKASQEADGGWNFAGSTADQGYDDVDTTALAIQALVAAGLPASDSALAGGLAYLRGRQGDDGSWGFGDPNSTAVAYLALLAAGVAPEHRSDTFLRSKQQEDGRIASPNDAFSVNTYATTQSVRALLDRALPIVPAADSCGGQGYELFAADGGVFAYGASGFYGSAGSLRLNSPIVGGAATPTGRGYYLFAADGGVFTYGDAVFSGSLSGRSLDSPIVGGATAPSGNGYLLFSADGDVFAFADVAAIKGASAAPFPPLLNSPIVGGAVTPSGQGYVQFAGDGGVFTSGDAPFLGSMGGAKLNKPIVGGAITPTGRGYMLVASDGGVFAFGDAVFAGSMGGTTLNQPIVGAALSPLASGYALFAADGGVFAFGDTMFAGSAGALRLNTPVVAGSID